jgi:hypothetical protein
LFFSQENAQNHFGILDTCCMYKLSCLGVCTSVILRALSSKCRIRLLGKLAQLQQLKWVMPQLIHHPYILKKTNEELDKVLG